MITFHRSLSGKVKSNHKISFENKEVTYFRTELWAGVFQAVPDTLALLQRGLGRNSVENYLLFFQLKYWCVD